MKNIVICSDGTGNTAIKGRGTNVFKVFEAVDLNGHRTNPLIVPQVAIYDDGVGTGSWRPLALAAGAFGFGLGRNVRELYRELVRIYDPGDRIFLFGFSRGAFTVRTLVGLIAKCGIINLQPMLTKGKSGLTKVVEEAYRAYRSTYQTRLSRLIFGKRTTIATRAFREAHSLPEETRIAFVGVWDTVDSVGGPSCISNIINAIVCPFKFPDHVLSDRVDQACQALSLDDERAAFAPELWKHDPARLDQVWFAGVHSNVGGGYPRQGMSLVALDWMLHKACAAGLRVLEADRIYCMEHANVDDQLYNPRAGLGGMYLWEPRKVKELCSQHQAPIKVHLSALERVAHGTDDYAPGNIPAEAEVVITETRDDRKDSVARLRARAVQDVLQAAYKRHGDVLQGVRGAVLLGRVAYILFGAGIIGIVLAAAAYGVFRLKLMMPVGWLPLTKMQLILGSLASTAVASLLIVWVNRWRTAIFSGFWFPNQPELRNTLKAARMFSGGPPAQNLGASQTADQ